MKPKWLTTLQHHHDLRSWSTVLLVASALLLAWVLYPRPHQEAREAGVTEILYWVSPGIYGDSIAPAVEEFERRNPEYRVLIGTATTRDATGDPTRFLLGVAGGVPPDLILFDRFAIVEWASRGAFEDLTPYLEEDAGREDAIRGQDFFAPAWNEAIYEGNQYAIPTDVDTRALYYNTDALLRAGFAWEEDDPEVASGNARAGDARPPQTWEEICRKLVHASGVVSADGTVTLTDHTRRQAVNEQLPEDAPLDITDPELIPGSTTGVRPGDVVALVSGSSVFRGRIAEVTGSDSFRIDMKREQSPRLRNVPASVRGTSEVKIFDQDGYLHRLARYHPETGRLDAAGFIPFFGNSWLYLYGWSNAGEFMSEDGSEALLDSPEIVEALQWLTDVHDAMGGVDEVNAFQYGATVAGTEPFLTGRVAMIIDVDALMQTIVSLRPNLDFGVVPAPIPEQRLAEGFEPIGWGGGWAHAIPSTAENKQAAWELTRWLASREAAELLAEAEASYFRAQGRIYFPRLHANRDMMDWLQERFVDGNPAIGDSLREGYAAFADLLPVSRYRPVTPVGQRLWAEHVRAAEAAVNHQREPYDALNYGARRVQRALNELLTPPEGPRVPWGLLIALYAGVVLAGAAGLIYVQEKRRRHSGGSRTRWFEGFICASPWLAGFLVFGAGPILFSLVISFSSYDVLNPARFTGLENYRDLMGTHYDEEREQRVWNDPLFWRSLWNTAFMALSVPLTMGVGLAMAMMLNTGIRGLKLYRTIYYLPAVVPAVAAFILWFWIFDPNSGMMNHLLRMIGVSSPPNWLIDPSWSKPSLILMMVWASGTTMIIWLAGLKGIPETLYEAAAVDGAGKIRSFIHVTIPMLTPYILFNTIMGLIVIFQIFEQAYIMTDGGPADSTLFYAYKLFNEAFRFLNLGAASAMAWILFLVVFAITMLQLWSSKRWVHYGG